VVGASLEGASAQASFTCGTRTIPTGGPDHVYPFEVTEPSAVRVQVIGYGIPPAVALRRVCESDAVGSQRGCEAPTTFLAGLGVVRVRARLEPGRYFVVVDQAGTDAGGGLYDLTFAVAPATDREVCEAATTLEAGRVLTDLPALVGRREAVCASTTDSVYFGYYAVDVPPGQRATVRVTRTRAGAVGSILSAEFGACPRSPTNCGGNGVSSTVGDSLIRHFDNATATARRVLLGVGGVDDTRYSIGVTLAAPPPPAAHATCGPTALALTPGTPRTGEDGAFGNPRAREVGLTCLPYAAQRPLYYRVTAPPRSNLRVRVTTTGWGARLSLLPQCDATLCPPTESSASLAATHTNTTDAARDLFVEVGAAATSYAGPFTVLAEVAPIAPNSDCVAAAALMPGATVRFDGALEGVGGARMLCSTSVAAPLFFRVAVPAGERLVARVTRAEPTATPHVFIAPDCAAAACASGGASGVAVYDNTAATSRELLVVVTGGPATLAATTAPITTPYAPSRIPNACIEVAGGTAVPGVSVGGLSVPIPMPFPFTLAGDAAPATSFVVALRGYLKLRGGAPGWDGDYSLTNNAPIPTADAPNGFVAPFWDNNLDASTAPGVVRSIRWLVTGPMGSRRLVVEWAGFGIGSDRANLNANLRFQAHLLEGSGAIEFHYCALDANGASVPLTRGGGATIGVEGLDGLSGTLLSHNLEVSTLAMSGYRLDPRR
jgi:hypothetical protein